MKRNEVFKMGPLCGVKALVVGTNVAAPMAGMFLSNLGADVILIEQNQFCMDPGRDYPAMYYHKKHRNTRSIICDWNTPEGKEVFLKLCEDRDMLIESSKGGQMAEKWGLSDEVIWARNPRISMVHVSGYGQTGDPRYVKRGGFDGIAQVFGGLFSLNGTPDEPMNCTPYIADQLTANSACWSALSGYICALRTGKGESFDVAAYEAVFANQAYYEAAWNFGKRNGRLGSKNFIAGWRPYDCKDGKVYICPIGASFKFKGVPFLGFTPEDLGLAGTKSYLVDGVDPGAPLLIRALENYCASKTALEADLELNAHGIPACPVTDYDNARSNPQFVARETVVCYEQNEKHKEFWAGNVFPKCKQNPCKIWRSAPTAGKDNEDILSDLGYSAEDIAAMYEKGVIFSRDDLDHGFYPATLPKGQYASFKSDAAAK